MLFLYVLLLQLLQTLLAFPHGSRQWRESKHVVQEVFISSEKANLFIGRHLLNNRFDFELFTPGNLERECYEERCNIEEAREFFDDPEKTLKYMGVVLHAKQELTKCFFSNVYDTKLQPLITQYMNHFWNVYTSTGLGSKTDGSAVQKMDVIALLTGLIAIGVLLVITGLLIYYLCQRRCKPRLTGYPRCRRQHSSIIFQRREEFPLTSLSPHSEQIGLPTYEQAVALRGNHDAPPPPYPGPSGGFKFFKKSISHPGP